MRVQQGWSRKVVGSLPGIRWREARLEERQQEVEELRGQLQQARASAQAAARRVEQDRRRASFHRELTGLKRSLASLPRFDPDQLHPHRRIAYKLRNYRLAASHGIEAPTVLATWLERRRVELSALADEFVLKPDRGHSGTGIYPLRRVGGEVYELLDGTRRLSAQEVVDELASNQQVRAPIFAEEVLVQPGGGPIPDDVKVYAAYGEVMHVMLRRMPEHANLDAARYRYLDADGQDLGAIAPHRRTDPSIPPPAHLEDVVRVAQHLSRAVGVPFCRVDLYDTDHGVVLGEITQVPGGSPWFIREHDERLGRLWEEARWRLEVDLLAGRPPGILHGDHPAPNPYPAGHISTRDTPGWAVRHAPCGLWCWSG